jgi:hypothetical protein
VLPSQLQLCLRCAALRLCCADPEIFERRYPVVLRRFSLRKGSGGAGQYRGGDGVIREVRRPHTGCSNAKDAALDVHICTRLTSLLLVQKPTGVVVYDHIKRDSPRM